MQPRILHFTPRVSFALSRSLWVSWGQSTRSSYFAFNQHTYSAFMGPSVMSVPHMLCPLTASAQRVQGYPSAHACVCSGWKYKGLRCLIIDEADRLLADGFQRDIDEILERLPSTRQTMMFSATNNAALQHLSRVTFASPPLYIVADEAKVWRARHGRGADEASRSRAHHRAQFDSTRHPPGRSTRPAHSSTRRYPMCSQHEADAQKTARDAHFTERAEASSRDVGQPCPPTGEGGNREHAKLGMMKLGMPQFGTAKVCQIVPWYCKVRRRFSRCHLQLAWHAHSHCARAFCSTGIQHPRNQPPEVSKK